MAYTFQVGALSSVVSSGDIACSFPSTRTTGDIFVAFLALRSNVGCNTPTNWTKIHESLTGDTDATAGVASAQAFWWRYDGSGTSVTFTRTGGDRGQGVIIGISGCLTSGDVLDANAITTATTSAGGTITFSNVTASASGTPRALLVFASFGDNSTGGDATSTTPSGGTWTEVALNNDNTGADGGASVYYHDTGLAASATSSTIQATSSAAGTHAISTVALKPAAVNVFTAPTPSGGPTFGTTAAAHCRTFAADNPTGGVTFGGAATCTKILLNIYTAPAATGGVAFSGSAACSFPIHIAPQPTGGVSFSGSATTQPVHVWSYTPSGSVSRISVTQYNESPAQSGSFNVSVPSDADFIVVSVCAWGYLQGYLFGSGWMTLGGTSLSKRCCDQDASYYLGATFYGDCRAKRGTQSLEWSWAYTPTSGMPFSVVYYKNVASSDIVRDSDSAQDNDHVFDCPSLDAQSGDKLVAFSFCSTGVTPTWSNGATEHTTLDAYGGVKGSWAEGSPSGAVSPRCSWTYDTSQDGGIIGIIVKPGDSAGGLSFGGSATTSYEVGGTVFEAPTPSGGVAFSGTASPGIRTFAADPASGGVAFSGTASPGIRTFAADAATGGLGFSGAAGKCWTKIAAQTATALAFSGAGTCSYVEAGNQVFTAPTPSGGVAFSGAGGKCWTKVATQTATPIAFSGTANKARTFAADGPTGGVTFSGTAASLILKLWTVTPSGGYAFSGAATCGLYPAGVVRGTCVGAGGMSFSGSATTLINKLWTVAPSGGVAFGGTAPRCWTKALPAPTGGITFSGAATTSILNVNIYVAPTPDGALTFTGFGVVHCRAFAADSPTGGLAFSGVAALARTIVVSTPSGGCTFSGTGSPDFVPAGAVTHINYTAKVWDGATTYASCQTSQSSQSTHAETLTIQTIVTLNGPATLYLSVAADMTGAAAKSSCPTNPAGTTATKITAVRLA